MKEDSNADTSKLRSSSDAQVKIDSVKHHEPSDAATLISK